MSQSFLKWARPELTTFRKIRGASQFGLGLDQFPCQCQSFLWQKTIVPHLPHQTSYFSLSELPEWLVTVNHITISICYFR